MNNIKEEHQALPFTATRYVCSKYFNEMPYKYLNERFPVLFHIPELVKSLLFCIPAARERYLGRAEPTCIGWYRPL